MIRSIFMGLTIILAVSLSACQKQTTGPEPIKYGRDMCEICRMIISDPMYATEIRGGPKRKLYKFDDIGDAIHWLETRSWKENPETEIWVMNSETAKDWLDATKAYFVAGALTPMDYGIAAIKEKRKGAFGFAKMKELILAQGLSARCEIPLEDVEKD
ncbi:MAG: hypothetical protein OIF56_13185 [Cohaesibacter sp.]|nr:hypothetical protein [Cohaesibacter sp.]MCV6600842.1 hypothetical protein [Cohaesibacter sp.]